MRKKKPVISNTDKLFCFNNNVSNLYNNSVVEKINGMAYIFTLLMFRKPNKTTINKNKTTIFYRSTSFDSRFYLDISRSFKWKESFIFRYFKVFQFSQMFTCGLSDLLLLAVDSLVVFVLREYILKVHILVSSEHKLCQIRNIVSCLVYCIFKQIVDIFFPKAYYQEWYILIIEYSSVVTVAEWLDGSFESQSRLEKAQKWFDTRKSQNMFNTCLSLKQ